MYDCIVIGTGFAGSVIARELAERGNKKVLVIEKRNHIGGNAYDLYDENNILIHQYGPHIFHTNSKKVYEYLSRFTSWYDYAHEVVGNIHGKIIPIPFNLNTLKLVYEKDLADSLTDKLLNIYGINTKVPILELMNNLDQDIRSIADYVYNNIFLHYTLKQWGQKPEDIDPSVTSRVPVLISYDNRYFQDEYQGMPLNGYTNLFNNLLDHKNIEVRLNTCAKDLVHIKDSKLWYNNSEFAKEVIYTGPLDELFDLRLGRLPYRSLRFEFEHYNKDYFQTKGTVNYTVSEDYTRITEFKHLTGQIVSDSTTIMKEYPIPYSGRDEEIPYYAIINDENLNLYNEYVKIADKTKNLYLLGRLAEYKYYNMDGIVEKALSLADSLLQ